MLCGWRVRFRFEPSQLVALQHLAKGFICEATPLPKSVPKANQLRRRCYFHLAAGNARPAAGRAANAIDDRMRCMVPLEAAAMIPAAFATLAALRALKVHGNIAAGLSDRPPAEGFQRIVEWFVP